MKSKLLALAALLFCSMAASAQTTAFTYQGQLNSQGSPANGLYDLRFRLFDSGTNVIAGPVTNAPVGVTNGLFTVTLDFGAPAFNGSTRTLEIAVRTNGALVNYTVLSPRQPINSTPYAIQSISAGVAAALTAPLPATNISGTVPDTSLSTNVALLNQNDTFSGTVTAARFVGSGSGLNNLPATNLIGTLPDARLSTNVPLLNGNASFNGTLTATQFVGLGNATLNGTISATQFVGNGYGLTNVPGAFFWTTAATNSVPAFPNVGWLATNDVVPLTITLPVAPRVGDLYRVAGVGGAGWIIAQNTNQSILAGNLSQNIGWSWTPRDSVRSWQAVASSADGTKLVAVLFGGNIYTSTNSGANWTLRTGGAPSANWLCVASSSDGSKLVAGIYGGLLYTSTDSGATWAGRAASRNWFGVASSADGTRLVAVANQGQIWTSPDSGVTWTARDSSRGWYGVASSANGTNLVAADAGLTGTGGNLYVSTNAGVTWSPRASTKTWSAVASSVDGLKLIATAFGSQIYYSNDGGNTWVVSSQANLLQWVSVACSADGSRAIAVNSTTGNPGNIYTSSDGGVTWTLRSGAPTISWTGAASSADGAKLVAVANGDRIYTSSQSATTPGAAGYLSGPQQSAVELIYVGNNVFMPISAVGPITPH